MICADDGDGHDRDRWNPSPSPYRHHYCLFAAFDAARPAVDLHGSGCVARGGDVLLDRVDHGGYVDVPRPAFLENDTVDLRAVFCHCRRGVIAMVAISPMMKAEGVTVKEMVPV